MRWGLVVLVAFWLCGCSKSEQRNFSPNGTMYFTTPIERSKADPAAYLCVVLEVKSTNGTTLFRENTHASSTQNWRAYWASDDEIVLDSSDVGSMKWRVGDKRFLGEKVSK